MSDSYFSQYTSSDGSQLQDIVTAVSGSTGSTSLFIELGLPTGPLSGGAFAPSGPQDAPLANVTP